MVTSVERVDDNNVDNDNNNNNNNSYIALYPVKNLQARGAVHYQRQNPLDNPKKYKYYKCIHQYQNDQKKARKHAGREGWVPSFSLETKT